ncbi:MAG: hypothetical protein AMXMBFR84_37340 [Candidatus Hydrogenedentota bacterium]
MAVGLAVLLVCGYVAANALAQLRFDAHRFSQVTHEFGFEIVDAYPQVQGRFVDAVAIGNIRPGGLFDRSGFRTSDILLDYRYGWLARRFVRQLDTNRGSTVTVRVVSALEAGELPLSERTIRELQIDIPEESSGM